MWIEGKIIGNASESVLGKQIMVNTEHIQSIIEAGPDSCYLDAQGKSILVNFNYTEIRELVEETYTIRPFKHLRKQ